MLWGSGYDTARAFVEVEHRGKILQSFWTEKNATQHLLKVPVKEEMRGGFTVRVTQVRDFGIGFDQEGPNVSGGLGLISMKERARIAGGTFTIKSELGHGTSITMEVPVAEPT